LPEKVYTHVMKAMKLGKTATEEIGDRIAQQAKGFDDNGLPIMSVWMFFNIFTWYIIHKTVSLNHRVDMEKRLRAAMAHVRGR